MRLIIAKCRRVEEYRVERMMRDVLSNEIEEAWQRTLNEIESIRLMCERRRIPFLIVIPPYGFQLQDPDRLRQPQDRLIEYASSKKVAYVDLLPAFSRMVNTDQQVELVDRIRLFFLDSIHFSSKGHELIAKSLVQPIRDALGDSASAPSLKELGDRKKARW